MDRSLSFDFALHGLSTGFTSTLAASIIVCTLRTSIPDQNGIDCTKTTSGVREDGSHRSYKMGRRHFLGTAAVAGVIAAAGHALVDPAQAARTAADDITSKSAGYPARAILAKYLSSRAAVEAHLEQIAK